MTIQIRTYKHNIYFQLSLNQDFCIKCLSLHIPNNKYCVIHRHQKVYIQNNHQNNPVNLQYNFYRNNVLKRDKM